MYYKARYLQYVVPQLYNRMTNWSAVLSFPARDVAIATFGPNSILPGRGKARLGVND
jgi:hypothetical protein